MLRIVAAIIYGGAMMALALMPLHVAVAFEDVHNSLRRAPDKHHGRE